MLTFDEESHIYYYSGSQVRSVTQIMGALRDFANIPAAVLDFASQRGTAVHKACLLWERESLDPGSVDEAVKPYLTAWQAFVADAKPEWAVREEPRYDPVNRFAGTPDGAGWLLNDYAVVEIKTTADLHPAFGVQLAGYKRLVIVNDEFPDNTKRFAVHLRKDGSYRVHEYTNAADEAVFRACLTIANWRSKWA